MAVDRDDSIVISEYSKVAVMVAVAVAVVVMIQFVCFVVILFRFF